MLTITPLTRPMPHATWKHLDEIVNNSYITHEQVLKLVDDMRNHPASIYMANNVPLVVSSDDPCFWEATSLSDDFYQAFLGIASSHSDLRTLKKLATNSIRYSAMSAAEKKEATAKWLAKWSVFIEEVIADQF